MKNLQTNQYSYCCSLFCFSSNVVKKISSIMMVLLVSGLFSFITAQPANDECTNATPITCGETISGTTVGAAADPVGFCGTSASAPGVWYSFLGNGDDVIVNTCSFADFDTKISVFSGDCASLVCEDGDDDFCPPTSQVTFATVAGTEYFIYVHGFQSDEGDFDLSLTCLSPCNQSPLVLTINTDDFGGETSWQLVDQTDGVLLGTVSTGTYAGNSTNVENFCVDPTHCFSFLIEDAFGDGICCDFGNGSYTITLDGIDVVTGGSFLSSETTQFGNCSATCTQSALEIDLTTDDFGEETTWEVVNLLNNITLATGGPYVGNTDNSATVCVDSNGCYEFRIFDAFGDGICCDFGNGSYTLTLDGAQLTTGGSFGAVETFRFGNGCPDPPVNDICSSVTPTTIINGTPTVLTGNNEFAVLDPFEESEFGVSVVWESFTVTGACNNVTFGYCGSVSPTFNIFARLYASCSAGDFLVDNDGTPNDVDCGDGNLTYTFYNLPAGTYLIPVFADPAFLDPLGDYMVTINSSDCPPIPSNDECVNATPIQCGETISGTTLSATTDSVDDCGAPVTGPGVWYSFIGNGDFVNLSLCNAADFDTKISVYSGDCATPVCLNGNDDGPGCSNFTSEFGFSSIAGTNYLILVHGFNQQIGSFDLSVTCTPQIENDACSGAIPVACGDVVAGSTVGFNPDGAPTCGTANTAPGIWYSFTGTGLGVIATTCDSATNYDTKISVYEGTCGDLICVSGNDDDGDCGINSLLSTTSWLAHSGTEYFILVHGFGSDEGDFTLSLTCVDPPANDLPCGAEALTIGVPALFDNTFASADAGEVTPGPGSDTIDGCRSQDGWCYAFPGEPNADNSLWFTFTVPASGSVLIEAVPIDGQLAVYEVGDCGDYSTYVELAGNDDADPDNFNFTPQINTLSCLGTTLTPGTVLYVQLDGFGGTQGEGAILVSELNCPANDNVCDAIPLDFDVPTPFDNTFATAEPGEVNPGPGSDPVDGCNSQDGWCGAFAGEPNADNTLWYTFTAPPSGHVSIAAGLFDLQLAVYQAGNCADFSSFTKVAANDDSNPAADFSPLIDGLSCLVPGGTYYVQLDGFAGTGGQGTITLTDDGFTSVVTGFTLVDAVTDLDIGPLNDGDVLNLATLPPFNIRADVCRPVGSVSFILNGTPFNIENAMPYAMAWDNNGDYQPWNNANVGSYVLDATPFASWGTNGGVVGLTETVNFTIIDALPDCNGVPGGTAVEDINGDCCQPGDLDCAGVCFGNATQGPSYLEVINNAKSWRKLKLGNNPNSLWTRIDPTDGGNNDMLCLTLRDPNQNVNWSMIQVRPQGQGALSLGAYVPAGGITDQWTQICIPLADFGPSVVDLDNLSVIEVPYSNGHGPFEIHLQRVEFTGGPNPYNWFGDPKTDNANDGQSSNGSALFAQLVEEDCLPGTGCGGAEIVVNVTTDDFGGETGWTLMDATDGVAIGSIAAGDLDDNSSYSQTFCVAQDHCYDFIITDEFGDGMCCDFGNGSYSVWFNGAEAVSGGDFGASETSVIGADCCPAELILNVTTDDFGSESGGTLTDLTTGIILGVIQPGSLESNTSFSIPLCVDPTHCFELVVTDEFGDGICCDFGDGSYSVTIDGIEVASGGDFGDSETSVFGAGCVAPKNSGPQASIQEEAVATLAVYPNPFKDQITFEFSVPEDTKVTLDIFSVTGEKVATLMQRDVIGGKQYQEVFYPGDLASGFYMYKLQTNTEVYTDKILLAR